MPNEEYVVLGQVKMNVYDPGSGHVNEGWQITYRDVKTGVTSRVFIPVNQYPDRVNEVILRELADVRLVHTMTGE